jgi:hypothetical protein
MRTWAKGTRAVLLTAGFVALGAGTVFPTGAYADTTSGQSSVAGGNQINLPISVPIDVSGNGAAAAGHADAGSKGGSSVVNGGGAGGQQTSGKSSVAGGNQINAPISAPINACGNAVAIFGTADAGCKGGAAVKNHGVGGGNKTSGKSSVAGGNQINAPISAPIDACGNAVAIFGNADAGCKGGAEVTNKGGGAGTTNGDSSVAGGNQVYAPISAPVNICGNAVALLGDAVAGCKGGASVKNIGGGGGQQTSGTSSVAGGNQVSAPISAPIDACGNAVGNAPAGCDGGASVHNHGSGANQTSGESSVAGGNQVHAPVGVPVDACGNAVALLGNASAECEGGAAVKNGSGGRGDTTSGKSGVLAGNQVEAPVTAPVNVCGNAVAVLGDASAGCTGTAVAGGSGTGGNTTSGENGVGSGNQVTAPVKAPVDVCGNVVTVLGSVDPNCGNSASGGGVVTTGRSQQDAPVGLGLPTVAGLTRALPVSPGSALPALPELPAQAPAVPMSAPAGSPLSGLTKQLPVQTPALPKLPATARTQGRKATRALPVPVLGGLTDLPGALPAGLPVENLQGLPVQGLPTGTLTRTAQLPVRTQRASAAQPVPTLPVVGALPITGHLTTPQIGGVTDHLGAMRPMAAVEPIASASTHSAAYMLTIGALLGAASLMMAAARRIRRSAG